MADYTHYDPATGRILQAGTCPDTDLELQNFPGALRLDVASQPDHDYVNLSGDEPVVAGRPALEWPGTLTLALGQAHDLTLAWPGTLSIDGTPVEVPAGTHSLSPDWPGTYRIEVEAWPAFPHRMVVEVAA